MTGDRNAALKMAALAGTDAPKGNSGQEDFGPWCLSIDLEVSKTNSRIHSFAAVRGAAGEALTFKGGDLRKALVRLDEFAEGAKVLLGHNLIAFDAPHLEAAKPDLRLLRLPRIDTLRLSPLAFPRNPYHHLVKHYQDGQLRRGRRNDPELDARLTLEVLAYKLHWCVVIDVSILHYRTVDGRFPYREWVESITDKPTRAAVLARVDRLAFGAFGDWKRVGEGVCELRIHLRAGYRREAVAKRGHQASKEVLERL